LTAFAETRHEARLNECKKRHQRLSADRLKMRAPRWRGVTLTATEQPIDTGTAAGKGFPDMLGVFAQFETNLRHKRQLAGIARAKANGVYAGKGRPSSIDAAQGA
jgi:DNA invertase Pin-like site-specific DNA recombinase